jgi:hypothetical protein
MAHEAAQADGDVNLSLPATEIEFRYQQAKEKKKVKSGNLVMKSIAKAVVGVKGTSFSGYYIFLVMEFFSQVSLREHWLGMVPSRTSLRKTPSQSKTGLSVAVRISVQLWPTQGDN